jgi:hypothetical protein
VIAHLFCFRIGDDVISETEAEQVGFFVVCSGNHMKRADANNNKKMKLMTLIQKDFTQNRNKTIDSWC